MLTVDESQPETTLFVDSTGDGLLAFKAIITPVSLPSTLVPDAVWLEVPVHVDSATGAMECGTNGVFVGAESIAPRAPFPVADCDGDMLVTQADFTMFVGWLDAGDSQADATHDGVINNDDLDFFYEYWEFEMNR